MIMVLMPPANASRASKWSEWTAPANVGASINTPFGEAAPAISKDGLTLYFVSNRPGVPPDAFGDNDIYVARRESVESDWGSPVNLGAKINTSAFEGFPALSRNEHHLFFFRAGDIFVSHRKKVSDDLGDNGWQLPVPRAPGSTPPTRRGDPPISRTGSGACRSSSSTAFGPAAPSPTSMLLTRSARRCR
jgi:hypothetical protein